MWIIINRATKTVEGTNTGTIDPTQYWNADLFEVVVWDGVEPEVGEPDPRLTMSWEDVRKTRDRLLLASDWTQIPDAPLSDGQRELWSIYRQELRYLPQSFNTPVEVVWPEPPEEV